MKTRLLKCFWMYGFAMVLLLMFSLNAKAASTQSVGTWDEFMRALSDTSVSTIELTGSIEYLRSQEEPLVLPAGITINGNNHSITTATAGIILNGDATLKNLNFSQITFPRNVIVLNGHSLTLENFNTSGSSVEMDVFCGNITDTTTGTFTTGSHGKLTISGTTNLQNIYAGNFSDSKGSNTSTNPNPVTVTVASDTTGAIQGFYGCGGAEPVSGGDGDRIEASVSSYPTTGEVTLNITSSTSKCISVINGRTGDTTAAKLNYTGTSSYERNYLLYGIGDIQVQAGQLSLEDESNFLDDSKSVTVAPGAAIYFASVLNDITLKDFNGGGGLVLGKSQSLTITGNVTGQTQVGINYLSFPDSANEGVDYIIAPNAAQDAFTFNSAGSGLVPTYDNGVWKVTSTSNPGADSGDPEEDMPIVRSFSLTDQAFENNTDTLIVTATFTFADEEVNFIEIVPFDISVNGTLCSKQKDGFGDYIYTYTGAEEVLTITPINGEFYITKSDYSLLNNDIRYTFSVTVPSQVTESQTPISQSCTLTIGTPTVTPDPPVQDKIKVEVPSANSGLVYNKQEQAGVTENEGYTLQNHKATSAGEYRAVASLKDGYEWSDGSTTDKEIPWTISPLDLTIAGATITEKYYDGTKTATVTNVTLKAMNDSLYEGVVTATGEFDTAQAGANKDVTILVAFNDSNYRLQTKTYTTKGTIKKLVTSNVTSNDVLYLTNDVKKTYTYELEPLLAYVGGPTELGNVTYTVESISLGDFYNETLESYTINGTTLTLPTQKTQGTVGGSAGQIKIKLTGDNFEAFSVTIPTQIVTKAVPEGEPILSKTTLAYGEALKNISLSGSMTYQGRTVAGSFTWKEAEKSQIEAGTIAAVWVFTPTDTTTYQTISGTASVIVKKATPTGTPSYTKITTEGKTLKDAKLLVGTISVPGTITWEQAETTQVELKKAYRWVFVPTDSANYESISGMLIPFEEKEVTLIKVSVPKATTGLVYNKSSQVGVVETEGITLTVNSAIQAGNYTAIATLKEGYVWEDGSSGKKEISWEIAPMKLKITDVVIEDKEYDGTKMAVVTSVSLKDSEQKLYDGKTTVVAEFENASAGTDKKVTASIVVDDANYILEEDIFITKASIKKLATKSTVANEALLLTNNVANTYTYSLNSLIQSQEFQVPISLNEVTYRIKRVEVPKFYDASKEEAEIKEGILYLPTQKAQGTIGDVAGIIEVEVIGENFEPFIAAIFSKITDKKIPQGKIALSKSSLEYNETLSVITISGAMTYEGAAVKGAFTWKEAEVVQDKAGQLVATWYFTPEDTTTYQTITGTASVIVKKGIPTGSPSYTEIKTQGKTLKDASLTLGSLSVPGTVVWEMNENTVVEMDKSYQWKFIPTDSANYESRVGGIVVFKKPTPTTPSNQGNESGSSQGGTNNGVNGGNNNTGSSNNSSSGSSSDSSTTTSATQTPQNSGAGNSPTTQTINPNITPVTATSNKASATKKTTVPSKTKTNTQKTQKESSKEDLWNDLKVAVNKEFGEEDITKELIEKGYTSASEIIEILFQELLKESVNLQRDNSQLYDMSVQYTPDNGITWVDAEEEQYPEEGLVKVRIKVPENTNHATHIYYVAHMFAKNGFGNTAGEVELPEVYKIKNEKGEECIEFTLTGCSPVLVAWEEVGEEPFVLKEEDTVEEVEEFSVAQDQVAIQTEPKEGPNKLLVIGLISFIVVVIVGIVITISKKSYDEEE